MRPGGRLPPWCTRRRHGQPGELAPGQVRRHAERRRGALGGAFVQHPASAARVSRHLPPLPKSRSTAVPGGASGRYWCGNAQTNVASTAGRKRAWSPGRLTASLMCCWWTHRSVISLARCSHRGTSASLAQLTWAWRTKVHGGVVLPDLLAGPAQQAGHDAGAQPARRLDPSLVLGIECGDEPAVVADRRPAARKDPRPGPWRAGRDRRRAGAARRPSRSSARPRWGPPTGIRSDASSAMRSACTSVISGRASRAGISATRIP